MKWNLFNCRVVSKYWCRVRPRRRSSSREQSIEYTKATSDADWKSGSRSTVDFQFASVFTELGQTAVTSNCYFQAPRLCRYQIGEVHHRPQCLFEESGCLEPWLWALGLMAWTDSTHSTAAALRRKRTQHVRIFYRFITKLGRNMSTVYSRSKHDT